MMKNNSISRKKILLTSLFILIIFFTGFLLRVDTVNLKEFPNDEKHHYLDENGLPYMYELDSYYNYRLTKNYLDHGYLGDTKINDVEWDLHSYYPPGVPLDYPPLIAYLAAFVYTFVNLFTDIPLLLVCFWLPAFIGSLAGIIAYFLVGRFTNQYGAVAAGIITVTIPFYFVRTVPGWFDTDMFNLIFPFMVVLFLFEAFNNINKSTKNGVIFSILSAVSIFLFSLAWNGWQYLFYIIIIFWLIQIIWNKLRGRMIKNHLYSFSVFLVTTLALVAVFTGLINIIKLLYSPLQLISLSGGAWPDWPSVYTSVSELRKPSLEDIISYLGVSFFAGLFGIVWICRIMLNDSLHQKFLAKMNWMSFSFLVIWVIAGFVSLSQGVRFVMLLIPPLVVSTGIMIGISIEYLGLLKNSNRIHILKLRPGLIKVLGILILLVLLVPGMINLERAGYLIPGTNDDVWAASLWIKKNTPNNTVIINDWSNGHLLTAIADRPVYMDGRMGYIETLPVRNYGNLYPYKDKSPSSSRNYWICKAFSTANESLSVGILRMISTSGDEGYLKMDMHIKNTTKTVEILNNILGLNRSTSRGLLISKYNLEDEQADEVLKYTHPENPAPMVLVTTGNRFTTQHWIFEYGEWNFQKRSSKNFTYSVGNVKKTANIINSTNDVLINFKTGKTTWKHRTPYSITFVNYKNVKKHYMNSSSDFCIFIIDDSKVVVLDKRLENSIFTKLVIEKSNSTIFKPLYSNKRVVVWEIQA